MELGLVWECPVGVEEVQMPSLVSSLVQSGIKLFLHQRNQIPLPVEQMAQKNRNIAQRQVEEERGQSQGIVGQPVDNLSEEEGQSDLKEHVKFMISRRRKNLNNLRRSRMAEKTAKREEFAVESITKCLMVLDKEIQENFSDIVAVGLFFGSSLHTVKEIVLFDLSTIKGLPGDLSNRADLKQIEDENNCGKSKEQYVNNLTRNFYKRIIMTDEFCEMTAKNLRSTRTHVCLLSKKQLHCSIDSEGSDEDSVLLLDNIEIFTDYLSFNATSSNECNDSMNNTNYSSMDTSGLSEASFNNVSTLPRSRNGHKKRKVLKIRLDMKTNNNSTNQPPTIRDLNDECLFCYQIPLRLKGILCKNTFK